MFAKPDRTIASLFYRWDASTRGTRRSDAESPARSDLVHARNAGGGMRPDLWPTHAREELAALGHRRSAAAAGS